MERLEKAPENENRSSIERRDPRKRTFPSFFRPRLCNAHVYTDRYKLTGHADQKPTAPVPLEPHWFQILLALADRDLHGLAIMNDVLERTGGRRSRAPRRIRGSRQTQEAAQSLIRCRTHRRPSFDCSFARIRHTCVSVRRTC